MCEAEKSSKNRRVGSNERSPLGLALGRCALSAWCAIATYSLLVLVLKKNLVVVAAPTAFWAFVQCWCFLGNALKHGKPNWRYFIAAVCVCILTFAGIGAGLARVSNNSRNEQAASLLASANKAYSESRYEQALQAYQQLCNPADGRVYHPAEVYHNLAMCLLRMHRLQEARDALEKTLECDPHNAAAQKLLSRLR